MPAEHEYLWFGDTLVLVSLCIHVVIILLCVMAQALRERRLVHAARNLAMLVGVTTAASAGALMAGFVNNAYHVKYISNYSEADLPLQYKLAGLWAGLDGSLLFWCTLVGFLGAIVAFQFIKDSSHASARRMEPNVYIVFSCVQMFFLYVIQWAANPFAPFEANAMPPEGWTGGGLNPLLQNYWMTIHPPTLYFGWVAYTVPFAYGVAALVSGEQGAYWVRKVRRWMMVGWLFNTSGIIMGGLWAYEVLGWGGYWAWDPVENASFLPWFTSTAFLHSIMVQERRDMLKVWNSFLVITTFFLSIFGTFLTRSGIVSSVHAFADGAVGWSFAWFLLGVGVVGVLLIAMRSYELRSKHRIESPYSREAIFVMNNLVLLALAAGIMIITLFPFLSSKIGGTSITLGPPVYNDVTIPFFALLLFFTAIGPGMGWLKTSTKSMKRNFLGAAFWAIPIAVVVQAGAMWLKGDEGLELRWINDWGLPGEHLYPAFLINYLSAFIMTALAFEVGRAVRNRARRTGTSLFSAAERLLFTNNRRYGGYVVHVGLAILAMAIVNSSIYRVKYENQQLRWGDPASAEEREIPTVFKTGDYEVSVAEVHNDPNYPVYRLTEVVLSVQKGGEEIATLRPQKRWYRKKSQGTTEVSVYRPLMEDLYVFVEQGGPVAGGEVPTGSTFNFTFFRNPYMKFLWVGWLTMVAGGVLAALPLGRKRVGLSE